MSNDIKNMVSNEADHIELGKFIFLTISMMKPYLSLKKFWK